ncbi:GntR family transcriptional regulator [Streptomyces sp. RKND-216]|uniref:FadR/GntR family transcriptional regulator n=1 Tax=Streptomyces sp. RKND-216 TaxID=2562581 RepID=UPI00144867D1|nr:GntR family transcriptional regulator [Streptomyces sp. RKND-216]
MSSQSTSLTVAAMLRERITSGVVAPGDSLPKRADLAAEFGVSGNVIRQALTTLEDEGLVTLGRGAPATVNEPPPSAPAPQTAGVLLPDRIRAAFEAEHVTIDSFSLTAETLHEALAVAYLGVRAGALTPRSIALRVMVPAIDTRLALPSLIDDPGDTRPLERLRGIMNTCHDTLAMGLNSLHLRGHVPEVALEFRSVPLTPMHKLYLLNGTESLIGYYEVVPETVILEGGEARIYDVLGIDSLLFRSSSGPDSRDAQDAAFVVSSQRWFDSLWNSIARPIESG